MSQPQKSSETKDSIQNNVRKFREQRMLSKAELARRAGISVITLGRVEEGYPCRLDTKRKILLALGLKISDRDKIFFDLG